MILECKNVSFSYEKAHCLLNDFNITISSGEIVGILGKSGSGKSTIGKLLAGYLTPNRGDVSLDGLPLPKKGFHPVQLIYQHPEKAVNPLLSIGKILKESGGLPLCDVGLDDRFLSRYPCELSGGQLQRVCIARALTPQTRFIIADEMTSMLDGVTQAELWHFFLDYAQKQNIGVLVITHNKQLSERVCHRMVSF